ncbi:MAG: hypothetical protein HYZ65_09105 [Burkholderiales bacterium]|nr:hypothetical protein [Burkholderiales bacterium]
MKTTTIQMIKACAISLALGLTACGGGSDAQSPSLCSQGNLSACGGSGTGSTGTGTGTGTGNTSTTSQPTVTLALMSAAGAVITGISPDAPGILQALVKDSKGSAVANVAVSFISADKTGTFVPSSGTALTDANGLAKVSLVAGSQAGAFTVTASTAAGGVASSGSLAYTVSFPSLTLSALALAPSTLSAGGTASVSTTIMNGASVFTPAQSVSFTSPCASAGKATISSPVTTVNGVATTSYTDKGCGGADIITASTSLAGTSFTQTGTITVLAATAGQIAFVSALPQNIALKGTGGAGRQESSSVTFKVLDKNGNPTAGTVVDFKLTTTAGGLSLNPAFANSGADGTVATVVAAGIVNTPVRVLATIRGTAISSMSDQLIVSTGIPDQNSFTISPSVYNVECMNHDGTDFTTVSAFVADHFHNPVPDGTGVSFTTEGGAVDASCLTGLNQTTLTDGTKILQKGTPGQCQARFICQNPRPVNGRVTVLGYALGEESFIDNPASPNVINSYDVGETFTDLREPFRYDRAITDKEAKDVNNGNNPATAPAVGEPYIDSDGLGTWNSSGDGFYHGVLQTAPNGTMPTIHVRDAFVLVFSTSKAEITLVDAPPLDRCVDGTKFVNSAKIFQIAVRDQNPTFFAGNALPGNILPAGTTITFSTSNGTILSDTSFTVPNTNEPNSAVWTYRLLIQGDATQDPALVCSNPVSSGFLTVKVTTPLGVITPQSFTIND